MGTPDQRTVLARLIEEYGADYAGLSRLIGRNAAYIQQFIKRGTPKRLAEEDRRTLARYFGVPEQVFTASAMSAPVGQGDMTRVPRLDVGASAGQGALNDHDPIVSHIAFDSAWLRRLCHTGGSDVSFIQVRGDSMTPTLADGDDILVDQSDGAERLRDDGDRHVLLG